VQRASPAWVAGLRAGDVLVSVDGEAVFDAGIFVNLFYASCVVVVLIIIYFCGYIYVRLYVYICMYICLYICTYIYIYI